MACLVMEYTELYLRSNLLNIDNSNQRYVQHRLYNIGLRNLAFEGLKTQRAAISKSFSLLAKFVKHTVGALSWVLQKSQNVRSSAEFDAILFGLGF
jgi:hypothetical protein